MLQDWQYKETLRTLPDLSVLICSTRACRGGGGGTDVLGPSHGANSKRECQRGDIYTDPTVTKLELGMATLSLQLNI